MLLGQRDVLAGREQIAEITLHRVVESESAAAAIAE
jgi:hypothetical protein